MKSLEEIKKFLAEKRDMLKREFKAEVIGIFGSYVRGEQKETSDVDVLVNFLSGATLLDFVGMADFLEENLGIKVDVVPIDTLRKEIKEDVLKEAVYL